MIVTLLVLILLALLFPGAIRTALGIVLVLALMAAARVVQSGGG